MVKEEDTATKDKRNQDSPGDMEQDRNLKAGPRCRPTLSKVVVKFEGASKDMNGKVFQTHSEQKKTEQCNDTLKELKVFASNEYVKHIDILNPIFKDLSEPTIEKPVLDAKEITVVMPDGTKKEIKDADPFELASFEHKVKQYTKDATTLKATVRSLFNVILGQCSHLMLSKLSGQPTYEKIEEEGKVGALLKLI